MKLKKKTSMMLVAASAVAALGVAAVSFAAWTGSYHDSVSIAQAQTGTIYTFGFTSNETVDINEESNLLVPYNQDNLTVNEGAYILTANLPSYEVYAEDYSINVALSTVVDEQFTLYVQVGETAAAAPEQSLTVEQLVEAGWQAVTTDEATTATFAYENTVAGELDGKVLSIILVSEGVAPETPATFDLVVNLVTDSYVG